MNVLVRARSWWWAGAVVLLASAVVGMGHPAAFPAWPMVLVAAALGALALALTIGMALRWRHAGWLAVLLSAMSTVFEVVRFSLIQISMYALVSALLALIAVPCLTVLLPRTGQPDAGQASAERPYPSPGSGQPTWATWQRMGPAAVAILLVGALIVATHQRARTPGAAFLSVPSTVTLRLVAPSAVDSAIPPGPSTTALLDSTVPTNGLLYVFLAGTGDTPTNYLQIQAAAAQRGYHALGLTYNNTTAVAESCKADPACHARIRNNILTGTRPTDTSTTPPVEGIEHRLTATLRYLDTQQPDRGWNRFLTDNQPNWSTIVFGGLSQGAGQAAYIGTVRPLAGETLFSSPEDATLLGAGGAADWIHDMTTGATPLNRVSIFVNTHDIFTAALNVTLPAMGLDRFGSPVSVDTSTAPYHHSHQLQTSVTSGIFGGSWSHASTGADVATPHLANGTARFLPVWTYMLDIASGR